MEKIVVVIPQSGNDVLLGSKKTSRKNSEGRFPLVFPGGHIHDNETPLNAAKRELFEETALDVLVSCLAWLGVVKDLKRHQVFYIFLASLASKKMKKGFHISNDLYDLQWIPKSGLPWDKMLPIHRRWVPEILAAKRRRFITVRDEKRT